MRKPERINVFCEEFAQLWRDNFPDWRFGQLLNNLQRYAGSDLFYLEEEAMLKLLKEFIEDIKKD